MKLNCRPGDLAVVIAGRVENIGAMVRVVRLYDTGETVSGVLWLGEGHIGWVVEALGRDLVAYMDDDTVPFKFRTAVIADKSLRPIRGAEGEDEILRLAGKPEGIAA